jgi:hypothetical protein
MNEIHLGSDASPSPKSFSAEKKRKKKEGGASIMGGYSTNQNDLVFFFRLWPSLIIRPRKS